MSLKETLQQHTAPLILDGAFGTMVQGYGLSEEDFRGYRYRHVTGMLLGNNEMLNLTRPDVVKEIHAEYVRAGADIITANTFSANAISQADYHSEHLVEDMNRNAVRLAREAFVDSGRNGFVIATIGPTNKSLSISPDINNPASRSITFDQLADAYIAQISSLVDEGVDAILLETIFDTLNAKAGIYAAHEVMQRIGCDVPLMLSVTVNDANGRLLSGQTLEAFLISIEHSGMLSVGLNCSFGADDMLPVLHNLHRSIDRMGWNDGSRCFVSCHPNAGLPNSMGQYDVTPECFAQSVRPMIAEGLVNIIGGCCGTTPEHIKAVAELCR